MTLPNTHTAYGPEYEVLERALASARGIRIHYPTYEAAIHYRARLHYARKVDRKRSTEVYEPGAPGHNTSEFDGLICRVKTIEGKLYLYIEPGAVAKNIEDIPEWEPTPTLPAPSPLSLPSPSGMMPSAPSTVSQFPSPKRRI